MAGGSFTITKLDENIVKHWDTPVHTAALRWKIYLNNFFKIFV